MPPRVTYWTGIWDPHREAISHEVALLRRALQPAATVVSFSSGQRSAPHVRDRVVRLSSRRWLLLRALGAIIEPRGDVTHAFGSFGEWHLLRSVGRRPVLFTVVSDGPALCQRLYEKVRVFAVESESLAVTLSRAGIGSERVRIVYPGVDLDRYRPSPLPSSRRFRVLFASTPAHASEFEQRGIPLLIEAARCRPDIEMVFRWRHWGSRAEAARRLDALAPPSNVLIEREATDMAPVYAGVHATVCCFAAGFGKACPNSIVEGLAAGRPAIVTDTCGISSVVARSGAGVSVGRNVGDLVAGIDLIRRDPVAYSRRARALAENVFALDRFQNTYRQLYEELAQRAPA